MMISALLARVMPRKSAVELMLTGRLIDAHEAQRLGRSLPGGAPRPTSTGSYTR